MMFHPKHVLIKDEFQKHRMDHQSDILLRAATKFWYYYHYYYYYYYYLFFKIFFQQYLIDHDNNFHAKPNKRKNT